MGISRCQDCRCRHEQPTVVCCIVKQMKWNSWVMLGKKSSYMIRLIRGKSSCIERISIVKKGYNLAATWQWSTYSRMRPKPKHYILPIIKGDPNTNCCSKKNINFSHDMQPPCSPSEANLRQNIHCIRRRSPHRLCSWKHILASAPRKFMQFRPRT
jgi:hypothetical protein